MSVRKFGSFVKGVLLCSQLHSTSFSRLLFVLYIPFLTLCCVELRCVSLSYTHFMLISVISLIFNFFVLLQFVYFLDFSSFPK